MADTAGVHHDLFSGLVTLTPELDVMPDVAMNWEILDGGRTYIFNLRQDVLWSDGRAVTAGDFVYSWRRALDPIHGSPMSQILFDIWGAADYHRGKRIRVHELGIEALNDLTLRVRLERPIGHFLQLLTQSVAMPLPRHVVEKHGDAWTDTSHIVTNGPFLLASLDKEQTLVLQRNHAYHGHFPGNVERIEVPVISEPETLLTLYEDEELDVLYIWPFPVEMFQRLIQRYADDFVDWPSFTTTCVRFDVSRPPFDDARVRRAFTLATDREAMIKAHELGRAFPVTGGFVPPGMAGHVPDIALPYNPEEARQLLAEAGYPDGTGMPELTALIHPWVMIWAPDHIFKPWRSELGVRISWELVEWSKIEERVERERPHISTSGWMADYPDPDSFLRVGLQSLSNWQDGNYRSLVEQARCSMSQAERLGLYQQAEKILVKEAPILPLVYRHYQMLVKPWVKNYRPQALLNSYWKDVIIEPH
jgi:oligopeptide transport system substrate-binding protein